MEVRATRQIGAVLTESDYQQAQKIASIKRTSMASILRDALVCYFRTNAKILDDDNKKSLAA